MRASRLFVSGTFLLLLFLLLGSSAGAVPGALPLAALSPAASPSPAAAVISVSPRVVSPAVAPMGRTEAIRRAYRRFPALYDPRIAAAASSVAVFGEEDSRIEAERALALPVLANNQILAFYGKPDSDSMGIVGEYPKEELAKLLRGYAKLYDGMNGGRGVVPAFYLIYGTCWPGGEIGYLKNSLIQEYIELAAREGFLVFVDHQIGKYSVEEAMQKLLPFLTYPNVHLALDPEWRTLAPMQEIGSVTAEEINRAQAMIRDYLATQAIPGTKMLVVHQFREGMILGRERVRADYEGVILIHTADGFGSPALKRLTYSHNARAGNMPIKGFKLFFYTDVTGAGYDDPLLSPLEVLALKPEPSLIIYQ